MEPTVMAKAIGNIKFAKYSGVNTDCAQLLVWFKQCISSVKVWQLCYNLLNFSEIEWRVSEQWFNDADDPIRDVCDKALQQMQDTYRCKVSILKYFLKIKSPINSSRYCWHTQCEYGNSVSEVLLVHEDTNCFIRKGCSSGDTHCT